MSLEEYRSRLRLETGVLRRIDAVVALLETGTGLSHDNWSERRKASIRKAVNPEVVAYEVAGWIATVITGSCDIVWNHWTIASKAVGPVCVIRNPCHPRIHGLGVIRDQTSPLQVPFLDPSRGLIV